MLSLILLACGPPALDMPPPDTWASEPALEAAIEAEMARSRVPGLSACVIDRGTTTWCGGFGWADIEAQVAVDPDETPFLVASVSKAVTAVTVVGGYADRGWSLDGDVDEHLDFSADHPDFPDRPITARQLLTHSGGIADNWDVMEPWVVQGDAAQSLSSTMRGYFTPGEPDYDDVWNFAEDGPGDSREYSNIGIALAAATLEDDSETFAAASARWVLEPLAMDASSWRLADLDPAAVALPYKVEGGDYVSQGHYGMPDYPNGGLRATAPDLARFQLGWRDLLEQDGQDEITRVYHPIDGLDQGLGFYYWDLDDERVIGHNGGEEGVSAEIGVRESDGSGFVVLMNGEGKGDTLVRIERLLLATIDP